MRNYFVAGVAIVIFSSLVAGVAAAQVPSAGNVYFGYTYYNTNLSLNRGSLNGWEGSLEGKLFPFLGWLRTSPATTAR